MVMYFILLIFPPFIFIGESFIGIISNLLHCKDKALKQIVSRLISRRHRENVLNMDLIRELSTQENRANSSIYEHILEQSVDRDIREILRFINNILHSK